MGYSTFGFQVKYSPNVSNLKVVCVSFDLNPPPLAEDPDRFYRTGESPAMSGQNQFD